MKEWAAGHLPAFETLYARYRVPLYRYVLRLCGDEVTANDLYQGSWEKVIRARRSYRPKAPFRAWLYRVAHNHVMDHFRRARPETELKPELVTDGADGPADRGTGLARPAHPPRWHRLPPFRPADLRAPSRERPR